MIHDIQKAGMWKRISAAMLDAVILIVVLEAFILLFSWVTGLSTQFDLINAYEDQMLEFEDRYFEEYGIDRKFVDSKEEFDKLSKEEQDAFTAKLEDANEAYKTDTEVIKVYAKLKSVEQKAVSLLWIVITFPVLISFAILEFAVPLIFKNGQTIGKKVFGIAVMRADSIKITPFMVFARGMLGKCTFGMLVPIYLVMMVLLGELGLIGAIAAAILLLVQIIMFFVTKNHTPIHDMVAVTVAVDMSSQMIFDTPEDREAYLKRISAESSDAYGH